MHSKNDRDEGFFLSENASKRRLQEAQTARDNRAEIVRAYSQGRVSRRDLMKLGLVLSSGLLAPIHGLNPFLRSAYADDGGDGGIPTGAPPSPLFGALPFTQPMPRFDVLTQNSVSTLSPARPQDSGCETPRLTTQDSSAF